MFDGVKMGLNNFCLSTLLICLFIGVIDNTVQLQQNLVLLGTNERYPKENQNVTFTCKTTGENVSWIIGDLINLDNDFSLSSENEVGDSLTVNNITMILNEKAPLLSVSIEIDTGTFNESINVTCQAADGSSSTIVLFIYGKPQAVNKVQVYETVGDRKHGAAKICWEYNIETYAYLPIKSYTLTATSTSSNIVEALTTVEDNCTIILLQTGEYYITVHATDLRGISGYKSDEVKIKLQPTTDVIAVVISLSVVSIVLLFIIFTYCVCGCIIFCHKVMKKLSRPKHKFVKLRETSTESNTVENTDI